MNNPLKFDSKSSAAFKALVKNNLISSFTHPVTYFVAIVFEVFVAVNFFIRKGFFSGSGTTDLLMYFNIIPYISIIVVPAICYKFSSSVYDNFVPLSNFKIIFAHFLSDFIVFAGFLLLIIPGCLFVSAFGDIDFGQLFISFVCLLFYGITVISVCCLCNEIFSQNVVSFLISSLILALFNAVHLFLVYLPDLGLIASFIKYISFAWHFDSASKGIFDTRDFSFFLLSTILFLALSVLVLNCKRGRKYPKTNKITFTLCGAIILFCLLNSSSLYKRYDFSKNKIYTVTKITRQLAQSLNQNLKITYYRSAALNKLYPQIRDIQDYLVTFAGLNKNISFRVINPDGNADITTTLENYGVTSQPMQTVKNNGTEFLNVYSAVVLEYGGNIAVVPFTMNVETLEYDIDIQLNQLISNRRRIVNVLCGNGMSIYDDYNFVVPWLNTQGFICNPIYLEDPDFANSLQVCSGPLLVLGDSNVNIEAAIAIENYILSGKGNAFLCLNPYSVAIDADWALTANFNTNLVEMVENWGIWFEDKITADISCSQITMYSQEDDEDAVLQGSTYTKILNYPLFVSLLPQQYCKNGATVFWSTPITITENTGAVDVKPVLITTPQSYYFECDKDSPKQLINTNPFDVSAMSIADKTKLTQIVGVELSGKLSGLYNYAQTDSAKVFVISDQYFVNSLMVGYIGGSYGDYRNFDFLTEELLKLNGEEELAELHSKNGRNTTLYKKAELIDFVKEELITLATVLFVIPLLIIISGVCVWLKRRSRLMHI